MPKYFLGLPIPENVKAELAKVLDPAKYDLPFIPADKQHITLRFLGQTAPKPYDFSTITGVFTLRLAGFGCFGDNVLFVVPRPSIDLYKLRATIDKVVGPGSAFTPHMTVAKVAPGQRLKTMASTSLVKDYYEWSSPFWEADHFHLYESGNGPYRVVDTFSLLPSIVGTQLGLGI